MDDHQNFFFVSGVAPTVAPCVYVDVQNPNPLPMNSWDEESVASYTFPEWLDDDEVDVTKPSKISNNNDRDDEDITEYTANTEDDDISERSEPLHELIVFRRGSSSGSLNLSTHSRGLVRSNSMAQLPRTVVSSSLARFLQDRMNTVASNLEFLAALKDNTEMLSGASRKREEEGDANGQNHQVARVNPLTLFLQARISTFQANLEILPMLLAEQLEACLHMDSSRGAEEENPCVLS